MAKKKSTEKSLEQLHNEIMDLFIGVSFKQSILSLVDTLTSVADYLEMPITDVIEMLIEADRENKKFKEKS